ncbi:MAG: DUF2179 domain-containing protein [Candidatus Delongbacteria bacterium]|jgi:uncharacterized protein YebE (UPF0316 family)|nr:DUF2179 domain-containing protein [Candidatus Delongbacteria bacterium]MDD4205465.1 DUF2179 domain-containing protein [Candidatus Delongbacteria bacterium]
MEFTDSALFVSVGIPVLIALARIVDVSIGTIKIIFISKGYKFMAPILAFFEIIIWLGAIGQVMKNLDNVGNMIGYAVGFAMGNFVGMVIENRIALGNVVLRVITKSDADELISHLREDTKYGVTVSPAEGSSGPVSIIFMVLKRADLKRVISIVKKHNPHAFYSIEDVRYVSDGVFPAERSRFADFVRLKKGK